MESSFIQDNIFEVVFFIGFIAGCVIRTVWVISVPHRPRKRHKVTDKHETALEKLLMFLPLLGMQIIPLIYVFTPWLNYADYNLPHGAGLVAGWSGAAVFAAGLWLLWRSHADLGRNWSPKLHIRDDHVLVTGGVFRPVRHPMYAAHWLWGIAQALLLQNWIAGFALLASFLPLYLYRVPREEQMMLDYFGEEYRLYMNRTGRIIPRL